MLMFTITSSTKLASLSLFDENNMLANINVNVRKTHSTNILDELEKLYEWSDTKISDTTDVIISVGPGSFTGVRIAMSLIKGLFTLDKSVNIYTVSDLDALVFNNRDRASIIVAGIDSRKGKIYASVTKNNEKLLADGVYNIDEVIEYVNKYDDTVLFTGDIYVNYREKIAHKNLVVLDETCSYIDSKVYYNMYKKGLLIKGNIDKIVPDYLEKSQAEKEYNNGNS
ncbi:tRNA (adenosine(37)-N6)-threonylcarbamoyltransferase complex dimerization subunit type 1 TsaB [Oceanivirga miroungae]|uniref:Peptidase M22 glycoprotease n=1 Tax=Oceanivirga miroungae TaxID=1130046 RepID=A0A6I8MAK2_9FUSO|nr:tRNA (adenosine(37)-N6)-threonylcarbamoyltransferase complex dimerization subunit type 1 TsaB [Oceanivirga miroungae]VWL85203.1 peptidase M22 glycoprotease [Oceanivirga miroungae]